MGTEVRYEDYEGEYITISAEDDDCMRAIREEIKGLPLAEKRIFLMYSESQTYSAVAKALHCSVPTVSKKVREIKSRIRRKIDTICKDY